MPFISPMSKERQKPKVTDRSSFIKDGTLNLFEKYRTVTCKVLLNIDLCSHM